MRSRTLRDGLLGLLILAGIGAFGGVLLWLRGVRLGETSFTFTVRLPDAGGLSPGSPVRYRGVQIGRVKSMFVESGSANVVVVVDNAKLAIPRQSAIETNQSGFLSGTSIDIIPPPGQAAQGDPLSPQCNPTAIVCRGTVVAGVQGVSFTQLLRETSAVIRRFNDERVFENLNTTLKDASAAAKSVGKLSNSADKLIGSLDAPIAEFNTTARAIGNAANRLGQTAVTADRLLQENKERIAQTLDGISAASREAQALLADTRPLLADGQFVQNLQQLSANAAVTAANLRQITTELNNPQTVALLRETLESARATFANTQKITADLDELTGDPKFRSNIRNLVNGLSGLVSSGQPLIAPTAAIALAAPTKSVLPPAIPATGKLDNSDPARLRLPAAPSSPKANAEKLGTMAVPGVQVPAPQQALAMPTPDSQGDREF